MSDPTCEEQYRRCASQVFWLEGPGAGMNKVADVVERHDDHHESPEGIDGNYTGLWLGA
jgi:hypothetical protein